MKKRISALTVVAASIIVLSGFTSVPALGMPHRTEATGYSAEETAVNPDVTNQQAVTENLLNGPFVATKTIPQGEQGILSISYWSNGKGLVRTRYVSPRLSPGAGGTTITMTNMNLGEICRRYSLTGDDGRYGDRHRPWRCEKTSPQVNPLAAFLPETYLFLSSTAHPDYLYTVSKEEGVGGLDAEIVTIQQGPPDGTFTSWLNSIVDFSGSLSAQLSYEGTQSYLQLTPKTSVSLVPWRLLPRLLPRR